MSGSKAKKKEKKAQKAKKAVVAKSAKKPSKPSKAKAATKKAAVKPAKKTAARPEVQSGKKAAVTKPVAKAPASPKAAAMPPAKPGPAAGGKKPPHGSASGGSDAKGADGGVGGEEPLVNPYGASDEAVEEAGEALGVVFPKMAIRIWKAINGGEINDWKFHPLREPASGVVPKGDIIAANTDHRPEDMPDEWITIAEQDGNHLVLEKEDDRLLPDLLLWDHDSGEVDAYSDELANFAEEAEELRDELLSSRRR